MTDQEIIALYFDRDEQAIVETAQRYGQTCMKTAMRILDNRSDAEECVNDTYLKAWNSIPPERPQALVAFLCRITRNVAITRYRALHRGKRNQDLEVALSELSECLPAAEEDGRLKDLLDGFLRALDETDRRLFLGRYWHNYPVNRLATAYGLTANAVSLRLYKTREKLRVYLEKEGYTV
ncbi:MAG: sigma-70 family RNA polymerase sigma factor [Ruminococcaceae bacterium]|nr:sigma-70 family RNA polymerase sigma factor [Oscillospiraceae bacterium]